MFRAQESWLRKIATLRTEIFFAEDFLRDCKSKINLIIARENFNSELLEKYSDKIALIIKKDFRFAGAVITDSEFMTLDFLNANECADD